MNNATNNAAGTNEITHKGFTLTQMHKAFSAVQNPGGWKLPIKCTVPAEREHLTKTAIEWFVGGPTKVRVDAAGAHLENAGYYANIGA